MAMESVFLVGMLPGFPIATTSLGITLGTALVVFILFNFWGIKENGIGYLKHLAGPAWYLAPLVFPIELISLFVRPVTLAFPVTASKSVPALLALNVSTAVSIVSDVAANPEF